MFVFTILYLYMFWGKISTGKVSYYTTLPPSEDINYSECGTLKWKFFNKHYYVMKNYRLPTKKLEKNASKCGFYQTLYKIGN